MNVQKMDMLRAVMLADGSEDGTEDEVQAAWQYIYDHKLYFQLQGHYGRMVSRMVKNGYIVAEANDKEVM